MLLPVLSCAACEPNRKVRRVRVVDGRAPVLRSPCVVFFFFLLETEATFFLA